MRWWAWTAARIVSRALHFRSCCSYRGRIPHGKSLLVDSLRFRSGLQSLSFSQLYGRRVKSLRQENESCVLLHASSISSGPVTWNGASQVTGKLVCQELVARFGDLITVRRNAGDSFLTGSLPKSSENCSANASSVPIKSLFSDRMFWQTGTPRWRRLCVVLS